MRGPMSNADPAVVDGVARHHLQVGVLGEAVGHQDVNRQLELAVELHGPLHQLVRNRLPGLVLVHRGADALALRGQEREAHGPADQEPVAALQQPPDQRQLVAHLAPAEHRDERRLGVGHQPLEDVNLAREQQPGPRRQQVGDALGRGVRTVGGAEGVVHVVGEPLGELLGEGRVVRLLALVEPQVLEHDQVAGGERGDPPADLAANAVRQELDGAAHQLAQALGAGTQRQVGVPLPLRAPEVRADGHAGAGLQQPLKGGHRRADARVVGHAALLERDVQVGAHQHAGAAPVDPRVVDPERRRAHARADP